MWEYNVEELYTEEDMIYQLDVLNVLKYINSFKNELNNTRTKRAIIVYANSLGISINISKELDDYKINIGSYAYGFQNYTFAKINYNKVQSDILYIKRELIASDSRKIREDFNETLLKLEKLDYKNV